MLRLRHLASAYFGTDVTLDFAPLTGSGSNRSYYRISTPDHRTAIGVIGTSLEENTAFLSIAGHFHRQNLPVPQIYAVSPDRMCYLQQDLGTIALFDQISTSRQSGTYTPADIELLCATIAHLPDLQYRGADHFDFSVCYPQPSFDERMISFDLNYFKYCFLKTTGLDFSEISLDDDFRRLTADLLQCTTDTFMYRDFQARNVMLHDGHPYFIDFQGGRRGPIYYDVASFVWQAKAAYPDHVRRLLIDTYLRSLARYTTIDRTLFLDRLHLFVLFRTLQVLGAYGFRGYFEHKTHFLQSIPHAIDNLRTLLPGISDRYPYLATLLTSLCQLPQLQHPTDTTLEVEIYSFSYKRGIPADTSSNGGGYVFDCRGMHNPGRYEQYRHLTGRDPEVITFLEDHREVFHFLDSVYSLVDRHVDRYISRGFTHLMISFGCTGGQHRSVYCADKCADHLRRKFGDRIRVTLTHREHP